MDWLVADASYLAWRNFHSIGAKDGAVSALLIVRDAERMAVELGCGGVVWAFDRKPYLRQKIHPGYKGKRDTKKWDDETAAAVEVMFATPNKMRTEYLSDMGYKNVCHKLGYEADDVMAALVQGLADGHRAVLVSRDQDLWQLLSNRCALYDPQNKAMFTARDFKGEYFMKPRLWAEVKALAGCASDDIDGLDGVAEITAVKFFRGAALKPETHHRILAFNRSEQYRLNAKLVTLPYPGIDPITPEADDGCDPVAWRQLCVELGLPGLAELPDRQNAYGAGV